MKNKIIEIKNISFKYPNQNISSLEDVSFDIYKNDFFSIIGPNGGGKSTLAKIILGCLQPTSGTIKIYSNSPTIGYVPQTTTSANEIPIKVIDLTLMGRQAVTKKLFYSKKDHKIADDAIEFVELTKYKNKYLSELSGGERQRAYIARAIASQSDILILDEPTSSIDPRNSQSIYQKLKEINKNKTIILITHDMSAIALFDSRIGFLNKTIKISDSKNINQNNLRHIYKCPIELLANGTPHRVMEFYK